MEILNPKFIYGVNLGFVVGPRNSADHQQMVEHAGTRLKAALRSAGRTQAWLAEELGLSNNAVSKWIRTGEISRENAIRAADKLGISVGELLTGASFEVLPSEAIEVARAWLKLKEPRRAFWRDSLYLEAAVSQLYPWLALGKPEGDGYDAWERQVERDMVERLCGIAPAAPAKPGKKG
jgi:transcriptional regulator with XRE-family HTH domain